MVMADKPVERDPEVDQDEAILEEIRGRLRERNPEKADQAKKKWSMTKAEEAAIGPTLFGNPRNM
jgi:hypothetical protein